MHCPLYTSEKLYKEVTNTTKLIVAHSDIMLQQ